MLNVRILTGIVLASLVFVFPLKSFALTPSGATDIILTAVPELPGPHSKVDLSIESYATDVNHDLVTWVVNGKTISSGTGKTTLSITTGALGSDTLVVVYVQKADGVKSDASISFHPSEIDLWWQSDSYVPPLYFGKALHTSQSNLTVYAVPFIQVSGSRVPAEKLVYQWYRNGNPMQKESGYGKSSITFMGSKLYGQDTIRVKVSTSDNKIHAEGSVAISTTDPDVRFYEDKALSGTNYSTALKGNVGVLGGVTLRAEPFYITKSDWEQKLVNIKWLINGSATAGDSRLSIREIKETQNIQLGIENPKKVLQEGAASITLNPSSEK